MRLVVKERRLCENLNLCNVSHIGISCDRNSTRGNIVPVLIGVDKAENILGILVDFLFRVVREVLSTTAKC